MGVTLVETRGTWTREEPKCTYSSGYAEVATLASYGSNTVVLCSRPFLSLNELSFFSAKYCSAPASAWKDDARMGKW